jgi:pyruvate/2-oxoglutarate dehydrogenase complex dihydrolipoamide dehydrogenase (E3) component
MNSEYDVIVLGGVEADAHGVPVDAHLRAAEHLWAIGDVNGLWPLTHVGKYQGDVVAANTSISPRASLSSKIVSGPELYYGHGR